MKTPTLRRVLAGALVLLSVSACGVQQTQQGSSPKDAPSNPSSLKSVRESQLPKEGQKTLRLIRQGGPFPYDRDGVIFGNYEKNLPQKKRGYYREYTVKTPGISGRGPARIVAGSEKEKYYTSDHYASFSFIEEGR